MISTKQKVIVVGTSLLVVGALVFNQNLGYKVGLSTSEAATNLLTTSDLTCAGVFLTPGVPDGGKTTAYPVAMRYENGSRHYFMYAGNGHVYEFPEPALSPCNTPLISVNRASLESWGGDWGTFDVNAGDNYIPGQASTFAFGLHYDDTLSQLLLSWSNSYTTTGGGHNTFAGAALNDVAHTLNRIGCWGLAPSITMPLVGSGVLNIPSSFVSANLPAGARYGVGFGGAISSYPNGISLGPTLTAVVPGSNNACAPNTDNFIGSGTVLSRYPINGVGPNCATLGCTPTQAPTAPYPAKLGLNTYSKVMYGPDWDPYNGQGWFGFATSFSMGWYDDGVKKGIVVPILAPEGWSNTTVLANPAPTIDTSTVPENYYRRGTMYVGSTSTHDGNNMNPGDLIWIQTCVIQNDSACAGGNGRELSFVIIDSVNPSTGFVAFHIISGDFGSGDKKPVVGGPVSLGCLYAHGSPTCSRGVYRLQIYDPAQYAEVVAGTRQPYNVSYNQEMDLTSLVPGFGCPSCGGGVNIGFQSHGPVSTIPDPSARQIMIAFVHGNSPSYLASNAIYVLNVGSGPSNSNPTLVFSSNPSSISTGSSSTLTWNSTNTTSCTATGSWNGSRGTSGTLVVTPTTTSTYTLNCTGTGGSISQSTTVTVTIPSVLVGDLNNDKIVNALDWSVMNTRWFTSDATADLNQDGIVNSIDFSLLNNNWGRTGT